MPNPTIKELHAELKEIANKQRYALNLVKQCQTRFTHVSAVIADRQKEK